MTRTRIAPSPTGFPHIGTMYQALFNYAYAHGRKGDFLVRIEDTDQARFVEGAEEVIFAALDWMGLREDESVRHDKGFGPYRQSERLDIYKKYALELVEKGHAYYCFCTKERLEEVRKKMTEEKQPPMYDRHCFNLSKEEVQEKHDAGVTHVIRMKIPRERTIVVNDASRGEISFAGSTIDDQVILKADGFPTYHLAVVVDDYLMKITDIVRGEEWISSAPKHVLLYEYFGWDMPNLFHTPILRNPDKSKLSKRHSHTSINWYKESGYLPEAIRNYLALMGWSHPEEKEMFTLEEFCSVFDLKDMKPVGPIFDLKKLEWMNGEYIRAMETGVLLEKIQVFFGDEFSKDFISKTLPLVQTRIKTLAEYKDYCAFFVHAPKEYEISISDYGSMFQEIVGVMSDESIAWNADVIGEALQNLSTKLGISHSKFFMALRVALSGKKITPPLNESMEILGREECVVRIHKASQSSK